MANTNITPMKIGDEVLLPDGEPAVVYAIDGDDVHVVQWFKSLGRGPWIFHRAQLTQKDA